MDIKVEIQGVDELNKAFAKAPRVIGAEARKSIRKALILLQAGARQFVVKDTGRLANALRITQTTNLSGKISAETDYAIYVHEGTRAHFPPLNAITPWANRHGLPAFVVARSIARKGTKANPFFDLAKEAKQADIDGIFKALLDNIINNIL